MVVKSCGICSSPIDLHENQKGLVFDDKLFVCEHCASSKSEHELIEWSSKMLRCEGSGMPIGLWLIHEQNSDKPLFSTKKR